jgi:hypothetical protein
MEQLIKNIKDHTKDMEPTEQHDLVFRILTEGFDFKDVQMVQKRIPNEDKDWYDITLEI